MKTKNKNGRFTIHFFKNYIIKLSAVALSHETDVNIPTFSEDSPPNHSLKNVKKYKKSSLAGTT